MPTQLTSVGEWLKMAVAQLHAVSDSPQLDAEILLRNVTGIHRSLAHARPESAIDVTQLPQLQAMLARRARGEPIAYIVGQQEFWSMPLHVTSAVLIPRPETELLVERTLEVVPLETFSRVLDIGTGSGAIALAIAQARPHAQVTGVDLSAQALAVAERNRRELGIVNVKFELSDWFQSLGEQRYDVIASNPPYIAAEDPDLAPNVAAFEPKLALIAGPTGFEGLERIVREARNHLMPNGWLMLEHGWKQAPMVRALLVQQGYSHVRSRSDLAGHERVTEGQMP